MTISTAQRGSRAPLVHHFRPEMTYSSPSRSIRVAMFEGAAGPPLPPGDDVFVAVALDPGGDVSRVAAGHVGLGHGERGPDLTGQQRLQPPLLLLFRPEQVQQFHVPGVGRLAVDRLRRQVVAPARQLRDGRVLQLGESGLRRQEQVPQAPLPRLFLESLDHGRDVVVVGAGSPAVGEVLLLGRQHLVAHEGEHPFVQLSGAGRGRWEEVVGAGLGHDILQGRKADRRARLPSGGR